MLLLLLIACALAVIIDINTRRIPNWLTFATAAVALAHQAFAGPAQLGIAAATLVAALGVGLVLFAFGILGAGDVKLIAAVTAFFGYPDNLYFLLYTALCGGALAIGIALAQGRAQELFRSTALAVRNVYAGQLHPAAVVVEKSRAIPYAAAIAGGALIVVFTNGGAAPWILKL